MKRWHRSEPETIRPFFEFGDVERALDHAVIILRSDDEPRGGPVLALEEHEWGEISPQLVPQVDWAKLRSALGGRSDAFAAALLVRDPTFKRRAILQRWQLSDEIPDKIDIKRQWLEEYGHGRELHLTLALCLAKPLQQAPGLPTVPGSWITQKTFELRKAAERSLFPIDKLTEEKARGFGVQPGALLFVDYQGGLNDFDEDGGPVAFAYVNEEIYDRMTSGGRNQALMGLLESEIVIGVMLAAKAEVVDSDEIVQDSPLWRVLRNLSDDEPMTLSTLKQLLLDDDAQKLHAAVYAATGASRMLAKV